VGSALFLKVQLNVSSFVGQSRYIYGYIHTERSAKHTGREEGWREKWQKTYQRSSQGHPGPCLEFFGQSRYIMWEYKALRRGGDGGRRENGEVRREEPPGAEDGTHVPCSDVLGDRQGHGPSIAHSGVLVRYEGPAGRRTAAAPHGGVSLGLAGARVFQRPLRVICGAGDSGRAVSHGPPRALGSALS